MPRARLPRLALAPLALVLVLALSASASDASAPSGYRFVVKPIAPLERNSDGDPTFDVYVKLNRRLPRGKDKTPQAELWLADSGGTLPVVTLGRRSRACYSAGVETDFTDSKVLRHPRRGDTIKVKLWVEDKLVASQVVHLTRPLKASGENQDAPYVKALGC